MSVHCLRDGAVRLGDARCTHLFTRLRPGAMLLTIFGRDGGELGNLPFELLDREAARFRQPLELYVDLRAAQGAAIAVSDAWAAWFARAKLAKVRVLVVSEALRLVVSVARHFSRTTELIDILADEARFLHLVNRDGPGLAALPTMRLDEPAVSIRESTSGQLKRLEALGASFTFRRPRPGLVEVAIAGNDSGQFGDRPFDILEEELQHGPAELFFDTAQAGTMAASVTDLWVAWLAANEERLRTMHVLVASAFVHLIVFGAKHQTRQGRLITIHVDRDAYAAEWQEALR